MISTKKRNGKWTYNTAWKERLWNSKTNNQQKPKLFAADHWYCVHNFDQDDRFTLTEQLDNREKDEGLATVWLKKREYFWIEN